MGYLALGIVAILIACLLPLPYAVYVILLIIGVIALVIGLYFLFVGASAGPPAAGGRRYRRW